MAKHEELKIGDEFTVRKDAGRLELPDGGWLNPGQTYFVTYDKIEFVNRMVAEGKIDAGGAVPPTSDAGLGVEEMRKMREEAAPVDSDEDWPDDTEHPDNPRAARNDAKKRSMDPERDLRADADRKARSDASKAAAAKAASRKASRTKAKKKK